MHGDPDLVDRIFEYLVAEVPAMKEAAALGRLADMKLAVRHEFSGDRQRIGRQTEAGRRDLACSILAMFNGRNATEVARRLGVSRSTVYRMLKQSGAGKSQTGSK